MTIHLCFEDDVYPWGMDEDEREYTERAGARLDAIRNTPPCPICGESAMFFKDGHCPYINAPDHKQATWCTTMGVSA
jgi:hypothetical protein